MIIYLLGSSICLAVLLQLGTWVAHSVSLMRSNRRQMLFSQDSIRRQIEQLTTSRHPDLAAGYWSGYREFYVDQLEPIAENIASVYLKPVDQKPIARFQSGQHLTIQFRIPGENKPLVRCYSLSNGPGQGDYRITVKAVGAAGPKLQTPGRVSTFINRQLMVGDVLQVKAPGGSFVLNTRGSAPIVLLAGGIGVTPMISMLEELTASESDRLVVLFYGVRGGREHAFKDYLQRLTNRHANVHVITCYSQPESTDRLNRDYQVQGYVSSELLRAVLPDNRCRFYLCGPPAFMHSLHQGLLDWNVPPGRIHSEAFGPTSLKLSNCRAADVGPTSGQSFEVRFAQSGKTVQWTPRHENLLQMAEDADVVLESGCRAGSCQTCAAKIVSGRVDYPCGSEPGCGDNQALLCIARPTSDVEIDA